MRIEVNYRKRGGWVFALIAAGYLAVWAEMIYVTEAFRFGLVRHLPEFVEMLIALSVPVLASALCAVCCSCEVAGLPTSIGSCSQHGP